MQNYYKDQGKSINSLNNLKGMKLASLNINSITKHIDELRILMKDKPLYLIAINESKIDDTVLYREIHIIGYNMIRKDRNRNGGGVIIYLRDTISFSERNDLTSNSLEMICLEIKKPHNKSFLVCAWYRPPNSNTILFTDFEAFLSKCDLENYELLIMGDLNCDISKTPQDPNTRKLLFSFSLYQIDQLINEPTRVTRTSATMIDLFFTNKPENILQSGVIHLGISDHSLIYAVRKVNSPKCRERLKLVRNFKNFNATDFVWDISQISWESVVLHNNPNVCWKIWQSLFIEVLDRHAPLRNIRIRATSLPWITQKIKKLMRLRDFHKKRAVKYNSQIDWSKFKETRNKVHLELRLAKKDYFYDKIKLSAQSNDVGKSWSLINSLIGKTSKDKNITELCVDDSSTSDDCVIAETFNEFFVSIGSKLASESCSDSMHATKTNNTSRSSTIFKFSEIGVEEVTAGLRNLKISKATGIDMIPSRALKIAADIIAPSITWIFNLSLKTGIFVDAWKKACVLPIYKSGDRQLCENYRPISILPVISKILESLFLINYTNFLMTTPLYQNINPVFGQRTQR